MNCKSCSNTFNISKHVPYQLLPCQHIICVTCVEKKVVKQDEDFKCPICFNSVETMIRSICSRKLLFQYETKVIILNLA